MPVIPEMDEFVNWDNADPATGTAMTLDLMSPSFATMDPILDRDHDLDLALENVDGDDFSFWALQHYENSHLPTLDPTLDMDLSLNDSPKAFDESFETPDAPCAHCQTGGYQCKRIREGKYKGYCTSCVALRCGCSFGMAEPTPYPTDSAFPHNPWPVMGDHPDAITQEDGHHEGLQLASLSEPASLNEAGASGEVAANVGRKAGARFSRESVKILKNWLSTHSKHPYPNEEEKKMLQKQTGLDKTQITNWLANARRRKKIIAPRSTSPGVRTWANAIDIPQRRGTPASLEHMNPLQRWQNSPPENEPASVTAIARAVTASTSSNFSSSGLNSPFSLHFTDDGSGRSICNVSSISSIEASVSSGGSFASAFSHASRGSMGSFGSLDRGRRRRRRKVANRKSNEHGVPPASAPLKSFQCTFCTETFRTKHDWQRHEKSLHLSLERWVCTPDGPRAFNPENGQVSCVFCGKANPDEAHVESHNHSACQERTLGERTFYRKDHLRQHLKLVHGVKFASWSMEQWKVATPEIRSRCGFCGIVMDTWTIRVDHLAEHFKGGKTMADWKGDWGFDAPVVDMVENGIPPYLIHDERNSPYPYEATQASPDTARNAYELLKSELLFYITNVRQERGEAPTDEELQVEACRIIFGAEVLSKQGISAQASWLRDLLLSSDELTMRARLAPIRSQVDSRQAHLRINGKDNIFDGDVMEAELHEYVKARHLLGLTAMDSELQVEACNIIGRMEESSNHPSEDVANLLLRLIFNSTKWLAPFRQRAVLPRSEDVEDEAARSKDPTTIDSTIHNYSRLESELAEYVRVQQSIGVEPSDADLQEQARLIIYEIDDGWNQTAADNADWLRAFRQRHASPESSAAALASKQPLTISFVTQGACSKLEDHSPQSASRPRLGSSGSVSSVGGSGSCSRSGSGTGFGKCTSTTDWKNMMTVGPYFFNDANCYRRLARELSRWCSATMSPNNPNRHIPSDEELQHQARWILYEDDDPWNQTAADNAEWLRRFKRQVGILTDPSLPGLPEGLQWNIAQGGSGFAPPYMFPNPNVPIASVKEDCVTINTEGKPIQAESSTATKYLQSFTTRHQPPASVFCSRELEAGLYEFVESQVSLLGCGGGKVAAQAAFPNDEAIRAKARDILKTPNTAADDPVLMETFKKMMKERLGLASPIDAVGQNQNTLGEVQMSGTTSPGIDLLSPLGVDFSFPPDTDLGMTDGELNDILHDIDFDFGDMSALPSPGDAALGGLTQD
ncbi:C2H2 type zinc finger-containing protein [Immersiella caudata]|uniref:C2H2 type zinc finger-containing protein n=1 Tax=Immersiella caudata TaxID=314043 RepID=A0AA40BZI7_9PEZI|nr:C2H2 type zinc finger-containing protein [Immersiella caudata]